MIEVFKSITGYEGLYEVSNFGEVRSLNYKHTGQMRVMKPGKDGCGYLYVGLMKDSKRKFYTVHRLVATAFIENPYNLPEVNHIDEDKTNNVVSNLEWCTRTYNNNYGTRIERVSVVLRNEPKRSKKVLQLTLDGKLVKEWESTQECGRNGFCQSVVAACCRNEYGKQGNVYKGYRWVYVD